jgi:hypothetical protein
MAVDTGKQSSRQNTCKGRRHTCSALSGSVSTGNSTSAASSRCSPHPNERNISATCTHVSGTLAAT